MGTSCPCTRRARSTASSAPWGKQDAHWAAPAGPGPCPFCAGCPGSAPGTAPGPLGPRAQEAASASQQLRNLQPETHPRRGSGSHVPDRPREAAFPGVSCLVLIKMCFLLSSPWPFSAPGWKEWWVEVPGFGHESRRCCIVQMWLCPARGDHQPLFAEVISFWPCQGKTHPFGFAKTGLMGSRGSRTRIFFFPFHLLGSVK